MSKFKEGDEVQISYRSVFRDQGISKNGEKMRGVINHSDCSDWWEVSWENNTTNTYQDNDLEPYKKPNKKPTSTPEPEKNVTFEVNGQKFKYFLCNTHYSNGDNNDIIFSELKIDKHSFCSEAYGYEDNGGSWPEWRHGDNEAPIKIVKAIREKIKQMESQPEPQRKFKVGDTVIGNEKANQYGITVKGWKGTVIKLGETYFNAEESSGTTFNDLSYECFDLVKSEPESTDREALLEEANRRYPIGTMYKELDDTGKVTGNLRKADQKADWIVRGKSIEVGFGYVYVNGHWAELAPQSELDDRQALLEEAQRRYPIGTKYHAIRLNGTAYSDSSVDEATYECRWVDSGPGIDCGIGYVYANGCWAEIVNEDKYVVTQRIPSPSGGTYDLVSEGIDISAAVIRNVWVDPSTKQLPDAQTPIIVSRSKNKSTIKVL